MNLINPLPSQSASDALATIPEEQVWLANFTSVRTRQTYSNAVQVSYSPSLGQDLV